MTNILIINLTTIQLLTTNYHTVIDWLRMFFKLKLHNKFL